MNAPTSVISAAVVGGDLILGLSDGAIINAGRVQGPKGLTGEQGPMGATGLRGTDGNTILSFEGAPQPFAGKDGDFAINVVAWEIYGPKAAGQWGTGTPLRGDTRNGRGNGGERAAFDSPGAGGNGQGGGAFYNTANLSLAGTGRDGDGLTKNGSRIDAPGGIIINPGVGLRYQSNANRWYVESIGLLDAALGKEIEDRIKGDEELKQLIEDTVSGAIRPAIYADTLPTSHPDYEGADANLVEGDIWYDTSNENIQYRYTNDAWVAQSRPPIYSETEPAEHPNLQGPSAVLKEGDAWYDTTDGLVEHIWDGTEWVSTGGAYVNKKGGDSMEGPLDIKPQPDTGSRDTNRVNTLGVYSNSSNSYLGLGTGGTKIYVGNDDTSFVTPIRVPEIQERNEGEGIKVIGQVTLDSEGTEEGHAVTKGYVDGRVDEVAAALPSDAPQPVDIGSQILKITGSRPTGAAGEPGNMLCWKAQTGGPGSPFNEIKFVVPDTSLIDLSAAEIWLKQGEVVQRWDTAGGGWFTSTNVLHISGTLSDGDDLIDGQPVELYYSDPASPYLEVISREESKADDRKLQAEIEELALGLETLLTQRTHGQWKYIGFSGDNIPRNAGEFSLASDDLSAQDNIITINLTDLNGTTIGLSDVEVGDYIEIVDIDEPANYVLFTCTKAPEGTGISNIEVALKNKGNNFLVGNTCEIRFFSINQENIDLSELDDRYLSLTGGALTGALSVANGDQVALTIKNGNSDRLKFWGSGAVQLSSGYTAFKDDELVTKAYVDNAVGDIDLDYLPLTGGELTGALTIRKNAQVALEIIGDSNTSQIKFWSSGAIALQNYTGFKDNELVTKKYVDDKVAAGGGGSSFTPGDQVAKTNGESNQVGGFWISGGALYVKVS